MNILTAVRAAALGIVALLCIAASATAQSVGDYRSAATGSWATTSTWERYNGSNWVAAAAAPSSTDGLVTIRSGHVVTFGADRTVDQVVVASGGQLTITGNNTTFTLANGAGTDLSVFGVLRLQSNCDDIVINAGATIVVQNGGVYEHGDADNTIPTATWSTGSTLKVNANDNGGGQMNGLGQAFYNIIWQMTGGSNKNLYNLSTVNGDFTILSISGNNLEFGQNAADARTITIGGNFILSHTSGKVTINQGPSNIILDIAGDFVQNGSGGLFELSGGNGTGEMWLEGDFTVASGAEFTEQVPDAGHIKFDGGTDQVVTVNGIMSNTLDVTVDKSGGRLLLATDFSVNGTATLSMLRGNILTQGNILTLGSTANQNGTLVWQSGTIVGKFRRYVAAEVTGADSLWPLGTEMYHRPASIFFTVAPTVGGCITGEFIASDPGDDGVPIADGGDWVNNVAADGFWRFSTGCGLTGGTFNLVLVPKLFSGITDVTEISIVRRPDGLAPWGVNGLHQTGTGTVAVPLARRLNMTLYGDWGIGLRDDTPLPIELAEFNLSSHDGEVELTWRTGSEVENLGFEVQRAEPGSDEFRAVASFRTHPALSGLGTSPLGRDYAFTDDGSYGSLRVGETYRYRLVDVSLDGSRTVHPDKSIRIAGSAFDPLNAYMRLGAALPNPAVDEVSFSVSLPQAGPISVSVFDNDGRAVLSSATSRGAGASELTVDVSPLLPGLYTVRITADSGVRTQRFLIVR